MTRMCMAISTAALAGGCWLAAQAPASSAGGVKQAYNNVKNNILRAAEKGPEADYGFKATPDVRTFGQLVGHVADAQTRGCSAVNGAPKQPTAGDKTAKADLVAAI